MSFQYNLDYNQIPSTMKDEEVGGRNGMQAFLKSKDWTDMNVGFALDEGLANPENEFSVFYGERMRWCNNEIDLSLM